MKKVPDTLNVLLMQKILEAGSLIKSVPRVDDSNEVHQEKVLINLLLSLKFVAIVDLY